MNSKNETEKAHKDVRLIRVVDVKEIIYQQLYRADMPTEVLDRADTILIEIERRAHTP